ncbi:hypothetical protein G9A89_022969 [Geosiphon pyriformis]|nr:hypothetical protein G9A89_022969 [Geosiphon pyriformis]
MSAKQKIFAFGYNVFYQTAPNSTEINIIEPIDITASTQCSHIIWANLNVTLGLDANRNIVKWGYDELTNRRIAPTVTTFPQNGRKFFGDEDNIRGFLDNQGKLYINGKIMVLPNECVDVAYLWTGDHVVCVTADGKLWQWNTQANALSPQEIKPIDQMDHYFNKVACGENHFVALTQDGEVFTWGSGRHGQLGHGNLKSVDKPTVIELLQGLKVTEIACGGWHSAVITDSQDLYTFGWNNMGRLGISTTENSRDDRLVINPAEPNLIEFNSDIDNSEILDLNVLRVSCGSAHTAVVTDDCCLRVCGWGKYGQLGQRDQNLENQNQFIPVKLDSLQEYRVLDCYCGRWNTFALVEDFRALNL